LSARRKSRDISGKYYQHNKNEEDNAIEAFSFAKVAVFPSIIHSFIADEIYRRRTELTKSGITTARKHASCKKGGSVSCRAVS
jgi:hypothetical protein